MSDYDFEMGLEEDTRSFVERIFFDPVKGQLRKKQIARIDCSNGLPEHLPEDHICLLIKYKSKVTRGRKDRLRDKDVLAFHTDKGWMYIPLDEAEKAAHCIFSIATSLKTSVEAVGE